MTSDSRYRLRRIISCGLNSRQDLTLAYVALRRTQMIHRLLSVWVFIAAFALPAGAQTVELSTRTFWVVERPRTMDGDTPFIALREIDWIEAVLGTDPVLQDAVVHIELAHMSVAVPSRMIR